MTANVIRYIGFSLYNCIEKTVYRVWKTRISQGISFCEICKHPCYYNYCCRLQSADKNYKRLTTTQSVGLKHANLVISVDKLHKVYLSTSLSLDDEDDEWICRAHHK